VATELGCLTPLTNLRVRRNLDLHWDQEFGRDPDDEMVTICGGEGFCMLRTEINDFGWLASLASLHRLTSLDLSQCHGVTMKALTALQGCTTLDTLALCDRLGRSICHGKIL
jgi:hypothetical protein